MPVQIAYIENGMMSARMEGNQCGLYVIAGTVFKCTLEYVLTSDYSINRNAGCTWACVCLSSGKLIPAATETLILTQRSSLVLFA